MKGRGLYYPHLQAASACRLIGRAFMTLFGLPFRSSRNRTSFEQAFQARSGTAHALAVPTNRAGLYLLLRALELKPGDEVIVTGFTCAAVPEPIIQAGGIPVYADIDTANLCMDEKSLRKSITERTRAIIIQHTFGMPGPVRQAMALARDADILVVEDCALALGSEKDGLWLGTSADAGVWSFELSKTISAGWGGIVGTSKLELAERLAELRDEQGFQSRILAARRLFQAGISALVYHRAAPAFAMRLVLGFGFRMRLFLRSADTPSTDARLPADTLWDALMHQLGRLDLISAAARKAAEAYDSVLADAECPVPVDWRHNAGTLLIRYPLFVADPQRFCSFFAASGIEAGRWFNKPVHGTTESHCYGYEAGTCPISEAVSDHIVNLPLHARLTESDVTLIAKTLRKYLATYPQEVSFMRNFKRFC